MQPASINFSAAARAASDAIQNTVIEYEDFTKAWRGAAETILTMRSLGESSGVLIQADPGSGKSLLLDLIALVLANEQDATMSGNFLRVTLDSKVDTLGFSTAVAIALGFPAMPRSPTQRALNAMIDGALERMRPKALLVDEAQHICEGNQDITAHRITDWLKVRMDRFNLPVVCAGTRKLERLRTINSQFTSRSSANYLLLPFDNGSSWRQLLQAFERQCPEVQLRISGQATARWLHQVTGGNLRFLKRTLMLAAMNAVHHDRREVDAIDWQYAQGILFGQVTPEKADAPATKA